MATKKSEVTPQVAVKLEDPVATEEARKFKYIKDGLCTRIEYVDGKWLDRFAEGKEFTRDEVLQMVE